jgi:hypothetical protein
MNISSQWNRRVATVLSGSLLLAAPAMAEKVLLTCIMTSTEANPTQQTAEVDFDQETQRVWVAQNGYVPAAISDTQITFVIGEPSATPIHFTIDRTSGLITVSGKYSVLFNGTCKVADPAHRAL